jgi:PAS domain-containing protein
MYSHSRKSVILAKRAAAATRRLRLQSSAFAGSRGSGCRRTMRKGRHRRREKTTVKNRHDIAQTSRERRAEIPDSSTRAGETCHRLEDYLDDLLDASFDGIVISDAEGNVLKANRAYQKLSNIAREEIVGHNLGDMVRN